MQLNIAANGPDWKEQYEKEKAKAIEHISFCIKLFKLQRHRGAYFLMEYPAYADSWSLPEMVELASLE